MTQNHKPVFSSRPGTVKGDTLMGKHSSTDPRGKGFSDTGSQASLKEILKQRRLGAVRGLIVLGLKRKRIRALLQEFERVIVRLPRKQAVAYLKSLDEYLIRGVISGIWVNICRFPRLRLLACDDKQAARTIVSFYREVLETPKVDTKAIWEPSRGRAGRFREEYGESFVEVLYDLLGSYRLGRQDRVSYPLYRMGSHDHRQPLYSSWHKGPNGPVILSAGADLCALSRDKEQLASVSRMLAYFNVSLPVKEGCQCEGSSILSKIVAIPDKGGKTRHIAIGDAFTQLALSPLHRLCMKILNSLKQDWTFKQGQAVLNMLKTKCPKYSLDLTSATDRFPV